MLYNVVLVSTEQQNESAIHITPLLGFPSHFGHYREVRVHCAIQEVLISDLFHE